MPRDPHFSRGHRKAYYEPQIRVRPGKQIKGVFPSFETLLEKRTGNGLPHMQHDFSGREGFDGAGSGMVHPQQNDPFLFLSLDAHIKGAVPRICAVRAPQGADRCQQQVHEEPSGFRRVHEDRYFSLSRMDCSSWIILSCCLMIWRFVRTVNALETAICLRYSSDMSLL